jgi:hypothetical protein
MVAKLPLLLSEQPPDVPRMAGLGDRFHYFRGASGRRYLFTAVTARDAGDFSLAVAALADRIADGKLAVRWIASLDARGRPMTPDRHWPRIPPGAVVLVHLLAADEAERRAVVADLAASAAVSDFAAAAAGADLAASAAGRGAATAGPLAPQSPVQSPVQSPWALAA